MNKLLNRSLNRFIIYAGLVLIVSIPVYFLAISRLWQYEMDEHNIVLTPEASREDMLLIIGAVTLLTIVFFILLLGGFILINRRISQQLWQPFYKSLDNIRNFDLNHHKRIAFDKTDVTEFAQLNESLDRLLSANIAAYHQQKEFADNASHELQTPLAIVQSKLEVLLQSSSLADKQYAIIEEALRALSRVSRINKNLLLLTKLENSQYMDKEVINMSALLDDIVIQFSSFLQGKQISLNTHIERGIGLEGNKILVELALQNLINNAIRHSAPGAAISVTLNKDQLEICNTGAAPLDPAQLFKRFATASSETPGTGLGLALVKQICMRYNWQISYSFTTGQHVFTICF